MLDQINSTVNVIIQNFMLKQRNLTECDIKQFTVDRRVTTVNMTATLGKNIQSTPYFMLDQKRSSCKRDVQYFMSDMKNLSECDDS